MNIKRYILFMILILISALLSAQQEERVLIKNLAKIEGIRENQLTGFGLVTGLAGKGDSKDSPVLKQVLTNFLSKHRLTVSGEDLKSKNCAVVLITADIPPFVTSGDRIPAYVSSLGDAKSLEGGVLLQAPLYGADDTLYAVAQGVIESTADSSNRTVGHLVRGAMVERAIPSTFFDGSVLSLSLNQPDFSTAVSIMSSLRELLPEWSVRVRDGGAVTLQVPDNFDGNIEEVIEEIENSSILPPRNHRIVVNSRTGVVVVGSDVAIGTVGVAYKGAKIQVNAEDSFTDNEVESFLMEGTARAEDLIHMLQQLGIDTEGIIEILIAIDRAGALYGKLIVM